VLKLLILEEIRSKEQEKAFSESKTHFYLTDNQYFNIILFFIPCPNFSFEFFKHTFE